MLRREPRWLKVGLILHRSVDSQPAPTSYADICHYGFKISRLLFMILVCQASYFRHLAPSLLDLSQVAHNFLDTGSYCQRSSDPYQNTLFSPESILQQSEFLSLGRLLLVIYYKLHTNFWTY